jgi:hypothetical protein
MSRMELQDLKRRGVPFDPDKSLCRDDLEGTDDEARRRLLSLFDRLKEGPFPGSLNARTKERIRAVIEPQLHFLDLREVNMGAAGQRHEDDSRPSGEAESQCEAAVLPSREGTARPEEIPLRPADAARIRSDPEPRLPGFWLDRKQERMARGLAAPRTLVYGPAGSGKTVFLVARARYWLDRNPEARVLFTCYNASLASHLRRVFTVRGIPVDGERLTVRHYHDLCSGILGLNDIHERSPEFYAGLEPKVLQEVSLGEHSPVYDLILVDEGQDFTRRMIEVLVRLCAGGGEITVVCDPAQDIYGRWSTDNLSPFREHEVQHLVDCYRNTAPIFALALSILEPEVRTAMGLGRLELTRPEDLGREGPIPGLPELDGLDDLIALIEEIVRRFADRERPLSELAILYPDRQAIPGFAGLLRGSRWQAAKDHHFFDESDDNDRLDPALGTLHPQSDRDDVPPSDRPHFAEALEQELSVRGIPAEWVARDFATKASYDITKERLTLCTIHSAKGMDFHTVIILGAESLFPKPGRDSRRAQSLLFTGITRAREQLVLPYFADQGWVPGLRERLQEITTDSSGETNDLSL